VRVRSRGPRVKIGLCNEACTNFAAEAARHGHGCDSARIRSNGSAQRLALRGMELPASSRHARSGWIHGCIGYWDRCRALADDAAVVEQGARASGRGVCRRPIWSLACALRSMVGCAGRWCKVHGPRPNATTRCSSQMRSAGIRVRGSQIYRASRPLESHGPQGLRVFGRCVWRSDRHLRLQGRSRMG
jgi:hypothetical protein